jgi:hypothetical protein
MSSLIDFGIGNDSNILVEDEKLSTRDPTNTVATAVPKMNITTALKGFRLGLVTFWDCGHSVVSVTECLAF